MNNAVVIIPTYNEIDSIAEAIRRVHDVRPDIDILVVDDNSPDGTGALVDDLASADPRVHVLHRASKDGLGRAYLAGFAWALGADYERIIEMDADGSHPAHSLDAMLALSQTADLVIGSRYVAGGATRGWPAHRKLLSRAGNAYVRALFGWSIHDATAGYRVYRASILRQIDLDDVTARGFAFQVEMTRRVLEAGGVIAEHPITFTEREAGSSKMSAGIIAEAFVTSTRAALEHRRTRGAA